MDANLPTGSGFFERIDTARQLRADAARLRAESNEAKSQFKTALARSEDFAREALRRLTEARADLESRK